MKGHYRLIPGRVGPSSKPLEQDQKQTSDPQNRCLSHPINQQQRSSFITDPLSFSVFLLRSRPSSELWARHCFFFFFFFYIYGFCAHALDYHGDEKMAPGSFLLDMLNRSKEQQSEKFLDLGTRTWRGADVQSAVAFACRFEELRLGHTFGSMRAWQPKCGCSETDLLLAETFI